MKYVNCTPHVLNIHRVDGEVISLPPSGIPPRVEFETREWAGCGNLLITEVREGQVAGLPEPEPGTVYIVSAMVAQAAAGLRRNDILAPGDLIRDAEGKPIGCKGLKRYR